MDFRKMKTNQYISIDDPFKLQRALKDQGFHNEGLGKFSLNGLMVQKLRSSEGTLIKVTGKYIPTKWED